MIRVFGTTDKTFTSDLDGTHGDLVYETVTEMMGAVEVMDETIGDGDDAETYTGFWVALPAEIADGHTLVLEALQN